MFRYVVKRLFLFIPTLVLISLLTFFLSKMVPSDQVALVLNLQGIDNTFENWEKEYDKMSQKMHLDLPVFYVSFQPNYLIDPKEHNLSVFEAKFATHISSAKHNKEFVLQLLTTINQCPESERNKLLISQSLSQLSNVLTSRKKFLPNTIYLSLLNTIEGADQHLVNWHYPVLKYHGPNNQYHKWMTQVMKGNFGLSLKDARPVTDKLWEALRWSILLVFFNLLFVLIISLPIGVFNGVRPGSKFDTISNSILYSFYAIPKFWSATLMIIFFTTVEYGRWTNIFPSVGIWEYDDSNAFLPMLKNSWNKLILPLIILVVPDVAYLSRMIRASVQEESQKEYVKTAISKGLSQKEITIHHILPNSLIPTIALLVGTLPGALASSLVVEVIFNIPGIGSLMFNSIQYADWTMVYPIVFVISIFAVILFLIGDVLMAFFNPKLKLG